MSKDVRKLAGRLKFFSNAWLKITNDSVIRKWIRGFEIPFISKPRQECIPSDTAWSSAESAAIKEQLHELLTISKGTVEKCVPLKDQFISNIFLVPKPDRTSRLILNLKKLNEFIITEHFKIKDWKVAKLGLVRRNFFMATLDLKDAYYLIPIEKTDRKFLRFTYKGKLYEFTCLPFGLNVATYVFTKILKSIAAYLRKRSFMSVFYLDDMLLMGRSHEACAENIRETKKLIQELGFIINDDKSVTVPSQRCKFLGLIFDSQKMSIELPEDKVQRTRIILNKFE